MHEHFKFGLRNCTMNLAYLGKRQFTRKYNTWKTDISKEARLGRSAVIHLRTRMQRNRRNIHPCYAHILNDESINANLIQLGHKPFYVFNLIIIYYRVQRHIHLDTINVGILHKSRDILDRVTRSLTGSELCSTDIHRIGTMVYGGNTRLKILCRSKKLYFTLLCHRTIFFFAEP